MNKKRDESFGAIFLMKKCNFWPTSNAALNLWNMP